MGHPAKHLLTSPGVATARLGTVQLSVQDVSGINEQHYTCRGMCSEQASNP